MGLLNIVVFLALVAVAFAEIATHLPCDGVELCTVSQVRITPCKRPQLCVFKRGSDVTLEFDFNPQFDTSKLETGVYWESGIDVPFEGFGSNDGCTYTTCPVQAGKQQTLTYNLHVHKKLPKGTYLIKWKLWNPDNVQQMCCFKANISIKK